MRTTKVRTITPALRATAKQRKTIVLDSRNVAKIAASYTIYCRWGDYVPSNKNRVRIAVHNDVRAAHDVMGAVKSYYYKVEASDVLYVNNCAHLIVVNNAEQAKQFMDWLPNRVKS